MLLCTRVLSKGKTATIRESKWNPVFPAQKSVVAFFEWFGDLDASAAGSQHRRRLA